MSKCQELKITKSVLYVVVCVFIDQVIVMVRGKKWYESSWYDMTLSEYMYIMECQHFSNVRNRFIITNLRKKQTFLNLNKS
jgi:hypothetical protein